MGKFEEVYAINVNDKTEKKGQLTYLSWAWAWAEFKKAYPNATYKVDQFNGFFCTGNEKIGYMVRTEVTAGEQTYEMWLPVMDMRNNTILQPKMTEINKTIMRCLTKNLAMFGLGLYIYAGEDLPEEESGEGNKVNPIQNKATNAQKSNDKPKSFQPLTKSELIGVYGIENPEKTIVWLEGKAGKELANFNEEETASARAILDKKKAEREASARYKSQLKGISDEELPFK